MSIIHWMTHEGVFRTVKILIFVKSPKYRFDVEFPVNFQLNCVLQLSMSVRYLLLSIFGQPVANFASCRHISLRRSQCRTETASLPPCGFYFCNLPHIFIPFTIWIFHDSTGLRMYVCFLYRTSYFLATYCFMQWSCSLFSGWVRELP